MRPESGIRGPFHFGRDHFCTQLLRFAGSRKTAFFIFFFLTQSRHLLFLFLPNSGIEDLREKREEINRTLASDEQEKAKIQNDLAILTRRLAHLNEKLSRQIASRNEYDRTIQETEAAYSKILESSQTLLTVLKRETVNIAKKRQSSS